MLNLEITMDMVLEWTRELGETLVKAVEQGSLQVERKSTAIDYVTEHDQRVDKELRLKIARYFPDHGILTEEAESVKADAEYLWVIDPIDGTTNFSHGFPIFAISVALRHCGEPVLSVVHVPTMQWTFRAIRGEGAFLKTATYEKRLEVSSCDNLEAALLATGFPYERAEKNSNLAIFNKIINNISGIRRCGSASIDISLVAAGLLDGYWEFGLKEWDWAAAALFIKEAGGEFEIIEYQGENLFIVCNPQIHKLLKQTILQ